MSERNIEPDDDQESGGLERSERVNENIDGVVGELKKLLSDLAPEKPLPNPLKPESNQGEAPFKKALPQDIRDGFLSTSSNPPGSSPPSPAPPSEVSPHKDDFLNNALSVGESKAGLGADVSGADFWAKNVLGWPEENNAPPTDKGNEEMSPPPASPLREAPSQDVANSIKEKPLFDIDKGADSPLEFLMKQNPEPKILPIPMEPLASADVFEPTFDAPPDGAQPQEDKGKFGAEGTVIDPAFKSREDEDFVARKDSSNDASLNDMGALEQLFYGVDSPPDLPNVSPPSQPDMSSGSDIPVPMDLEGVSAPPDIDKNFKLEADRFKPEGVLQVACLFPEGSELQGQRFVTRLRQAGKKLSKPIEIQAVYVQPWHENAINVKAWQQSASLSGADYIFILVSKVQKDLFSEFKGQGPDGWHGRIVLLEHVDMFPLYPDILIRLGQEQK